MAPFTDELETAIAQGIREDGLGKPDEETVAKYQDLFACSYTEAVEKARKHQLELHGYLTTQSQGTRPKTSPPGKGDKSATYLVRLEDVLSDAAAVKLAAGLNDEPEVVSGRNDAGDASDFCRVDGSAKARILLHLAEEGSPFRPTFLQITRADKSLSSVSSAPTLGRDSTLPQFRAATGATQFHPAQNQYPVWYFFYGILTDPEELSLILGLSSPPQYRPAAVQNGSLLSIRQLVDADTMGGSGVAGQAYLVENDAQENGLRYAVTDKYEVVRCEIEMLDSGESVEGLTFRYMAG